MSSSGPPMASFKLCEARCQPILSQAATLENTFHLVNGDSLQENRYLAGNSGFVCVY